MPICLKSLLAAPTEPNEQRYLPPNVTTKGKMEQTVTQKRNTDEIRPSPSKTKKGTEQDRKTNEQNIMGE